MNDKKTKEWIPWALRRTNPDMFYFKDDGIFPNSKLPALVYSGLFRDDYDCCEQWLEDTFSGNQWRRALKNPLFGFPHYHSNTHEVLGVCEGSAFIELGGANGIKTEIVKGDVIVIPAGVAHRCVDHSKDFKVVGGYPGEVIPDVKTGLPEEREEALKNIASLDIPKFDPILGEDEVGLIKFWK